MSRYAETVRKGSPFSSLSFLIVSPKPSILNKFVLNIFVKNTTSFLNILHNIGKVINSTVRLQDCTLPAKKSLWVDLCVFCRMCAMWVGFFFLFLWAGRKNKINSSRFALFFQRAKSIFVSILSFQLSVSRSFTLVANICVGVSLLHLF